MVMKATLAAGEFEARRLARRDEVRRKRRECVISKPGKPVARSVPREPKRKPEDIFGRRKGTVRRHGYIFSNGEPWEAK